MPSDWNAEYQRFIAETMPLLEAHATALVPAAKAGDEQANRVVDLYSQTYRTFDVAVAQELRECLDRWIESSAAATASKATGNRMDPDDSSATGGDAQSR